MEIIALETVQWHRLPGIDDVAPLTDADYDVIHEVGEVLRRHGQTSRFGVCLLHKHFDLSPDEELIEETDPAARVSVLRVRTAKDEREQSIETMWRFGSEIDSITKCILECDYSSGHKRVHVKRGY